MTETSPRGAASPQRRSRVVRAALLGCVIAAGLAWRSEFLALPPFASKYGGDALWALAAFVALGVLLPRASTTRVTLLALAFSAAVELSQLYHADWIDRIRATRLGALALGSTWNSPDLLAYALGIALGATAEAVACHRNVPQ